MSTPLERFRETLFAKGGGACFECCDYEKMYKELEALITLELSLKEQETIERVREWAKSKNKGEPLKPEFLHYNIGYDNALEDLSLFLDTLTNEKR